MKTPWHQTFTWRYLYRPFLVGLYAVITGGRSIHGGPYVPGRR